MEVVVQEVRGTGKVVKFGVSLMRFLRHPLKYSFTEGVTFYGKKKAVELIVEPLNKNLVKPAKENVVEPMMEGGSNLVKTAKKKFNNVVEKGKNFIKKASFNLKEKLVGVTDKEKKINTIELFIGENGEADDIIALYDEGEVELNFKDRLEIIKYAVKRDRKEISKSLIEREAGIIRSNIDKLKEQENRIIELKKKNEELTKKQNMKNKWYGKVISFFNRGYFSRINNELNNNKDELRTEEKENKNLIKENKVEYSLAYEYKDNSRNFDYINNFNKDVKEERRNNLKLNDVLGNLNSAINDINQLLDRSRNY